MKIIIGFIGKLSSGKGTACTYLSEKYGSKTVMFSQSLRDVLDRVYLPQTRENMQKLSQVLRENFSQDILANVVAEDAKKAEAEVVAIDGVRRPKDLGYLRQMDNFFLVSIEADQKTRYERMLTRGQNPGESASELTFEQFQKNESAEAESLIDEVAKEAKFKINNDGTKEDLYKQIEDIIKQAKG